MSPASQAPRRASSEQSLSLWREYRETNDRALRDRLILTFAPLVKYIVYKKAREVPAHCEIEDLIACGLEALMRTIERFDPELGSTLEQYAWTRIHGAVLDELRRQDWAPRSVRRWERDINRASAEFTALHGRHATQQELADALGVDVATLRDRRSDIARSDVTSLNSIVTCDEDMTVERVDTLASHDAALDPERAVEVSDAKARFRAAFSRLNQREREIIVLMYVKNLTMVETGSIIGVTESRICQLHGAIKRKLRAELDSDAELMRLVA